MSKTTHYELNTPIGSEVLSVMTGLNPNFTTIDKTMYDNETRSTQALNKANVNEQNIATALGRITTAEGDIDTLEKGLETANTNISGLTSRMSTTESGLVSANNRIQENTNSITTINTKLANIDHTTISVASLTPVNATITRFNGFIENKTVHVDMTFSITGTNGGTISGFPVNKGNSVSIPTSSTGNTYHPSHALLDNGVLQLVGFHNDAFYCNFTYEID